MFNLFKKKEGDTPPDVGQEDVYDAKKAEDEGASEKEIPKLEKPDLKKKLGIKKAVIGSVGQEMNNLEFEKIKARIDSVVEWINQFYERFSYVSESIGELRSMNLANEKKIANATKEADKVIDIVKEVKPEQLRIDYQRVDMRIKKFEEMIAENKNFVESVVKEFSDLKKKSDVFVGTEALVKLNEDTKKELIETQKLSSQTRLNADKGKEIFLELKKGFGDYQKLGEIATTLDASYSGLKGEVDTLKLNLDTVVKRDEYSDFRKTYGNKLAVFDSIVSEMQELKESNQNFHQLMETALSVSKRNEEDIANMALKVGDNHSKRIEDYENQLADVVEIVETLAEHITELKKKVSIKDEKVLEIVEKEKDLEKDIEKKIKRKSKKTTSSKSKIKKPKSKVEKVEEEESSDEEDYEVLPQKSQSQESDEVEKEGGVEIEEGVEKVESKGVVEGKEKPQEKKKGLFKKLFG